MVDKLRGKLHVLINRLLDFVRGEDKKEDTRLAEALNVMQDGLARQRDAVTLALAIMTQKRQELSSAINTYEALRQEAKELLANGQRQQAFDTAALIAHEEHRIVQLTNQYKSLKVATESALAAYRSYSAEVQLRLRRMNELQQIERISRLQEEAQVFFDSFVQEGSLADFDTVDKAIVDKSEQLSARQQLFALDERQAEQDLESQFNTLKINAIVEALESESHGNSTKHGGAQVLVQSDPLKSAKLLLRTPLLEPSAARPRDPARPPTAITDKEDDS